MTRSWNESQARIGHVREALERAHAMARETIAATDLRVTEIATRERVRVAATAEAREGELQAARLALGEACGRAESGLLDFAASMRAGTRSIGGDR